MPFTMENVNYAVQYSQALANVYPYLSYFNEVWNSPNSSTYRPVNGKTVMIPSLTVSGARAVDRNNIDGNFSRNFNNQYQPVTCQMYREWDTLVDPMDIVQTEGKNRASQKGLRTTLRLYGGKHNNTSFLL